MTKLIKAEGFTEFVKQHLIGYDERRPCNGFDLLQDVIFIRRNLELGKDDNLQITLNSSLSTSNHFISVTYFYDIEPHDAVSLKATLYDMVFAKPTLPKTTK